jgi:hypothetical protein
LCLKFQVNVSVKSRPEQAGNPCPAPPLLKLVAPFVS